jgi:hypothetical protein
MINQFQNVIDNDASFDINLENRTVILKYERACKYKSFMEILKKITFLMKILQ